MWVYRVEEKVTEMGDQLAHKLKQNAIKVLSIFYKSKLQGQHQREQFLDIRKTETLDIFKCAVRQQVLFI